MKNSSKKEKSTILSTLSIEEIHQQLLEELPFEDRKDFENAARGFIATRANSEIKNTSGQVVFDLSWFDFLKEETPKTVNPCLWRQGQLNRMHGLFQVTDGIYQVRGFDLANLTVVATNNGWIVIDALTTEEASRAAMELIHQHLGEKPIKAVIITHSHIDHFGGIKGVVTEEEITNGTVEIIAPEGFFESAVSENILAGNAMQRRAMYMFGTLLPLGATGNVGCGLGQSISLGKTDIVKPTLTISETGQRVTIDGIEIIFQNTPDAEAPAECMFYFPHYKAFCQAEEINHTLHNLYTPRGAEVRNGLKWSKYIDEAIQLFGDEVQISFGGHHWPTWGNEEILKLWTKQRDLYRYIHDETLHLANQGHTMIEIAEQVKLPPTLATFFANRSYYGTVSHNVKAQYQLYYGWFDGNPANLHALPPTAAAEKYLSYMGGANAVLEKVQVDIENGEYRWAAMVLNQVIFADSHNKKARTLLAEVYTQLGYRAESGPWRNFYLTGAQELQEGVTFQHVRGRMIRDNIIKNLTLENFYDYLAIRLDRSKAQGKEYFFNMIFPDTQETISLHLINQVLHNRPGVLAKNPTTTITMNRSIFNDIITNKTTALEKVGSGAILIEGSQSDYADFQGMIADPFRASFNIIEP